MPPLRALPVLVVVAAALVLAADTQTPKPPATPVHEVTDDYHGVSITDPYRWLEDQNSPETRSWIDAENAYTQKVLSQFTGRSGLRSQIEKVLKIDSIGMPARRGDRYFYLRRRADQNLDMLCMREKGKETVLVDPNTLAPDGSISVVTMGGSEDGNLLAYGQRKGGADEVAVTLLDINSLKPLADSFPVARYGSFHVTPDHKAIYYTKYTPGVGPRAYLHTMGGDVASDKEIFGHENGAGDFIAADLSPDGRYLVLEVSHGSAAEKTELYFQDLKSGAPIHTIVNDINANFSFDLAGNHVYVRTNWQAPNSRLIDVDLRHPARAGWKTIIPETSSAMENVTAAGGKLFVSYLQNVVTHIKVFDPTGKFLRDVELPEIGSAAVVGRWNQDEVFYRFSSFSTPRAIFSYSASTGKQSEWARVTVPIPTEQLQTEQVWYESKDGTRIPMFLVFRKGTAPDEHLPLPTLLTGYGGFRISETPSFSPMAAVWALSGGVYARPNLRGGGEFGEKWHKAGMLRDKQNVFDDFTSAAEWLIEHKYTNPAKLAITGGSNGGLLVGAALTQRPDLFRAVVCSYPLLDMLRYEKFLVARFWVPEYGSAADSAEQFKYLRAYSPYQNVKKGTKYPAVMFVTGDSDTRVAPLHARKMAALMQAENGDSNPILLRYDTSAGHSRGGVAINKQIDEMTDELGFLMSQLGVK
ncbi:MAG TPA: prolyl oligopeptidase family serine peptidase [Terriglobales bacterium]|nr:prolyl oligopeptidase family serine peptidase [Terriglobales bacterium]